MMKGSRWSPLQLANPQMGLTGSLPASPQRGQMNRPSLHPSSPRQHSKRVLHRSIIVMFMLTMKTLFMPFYFFFVRNIIDVSAADSVMMEQHEYMDKARQYRYNGIQLVDDCRGTVAELLDCVLFSVLGCWKSVSLGKLWLLKWKVPELHWSVDGYFLPAK